jgi:hypothetical protein
MPDYRAGDTAGGIKLGLLRRPETANRGPMRLVPLTLLLAVTLSAAAPTTPYKVGDAFAPFTTKDQHDKPYTYEGGARTVIVAFDMSSGKAANAFFEKQPADFLPQQKAIFISNIHGMPGIARVFAMPKMKKYPHRILLADAEGFLARYPVKEDHLTVLSLDDKGTITDVRHLKPAKELASVFAPQK